jgi:glutamate carboxypeptidase
MEETSQNKNLFLILKQVADQLGINIKKEFRHGVSDANFLAQAGIPVLDGLGPCGADDHSEDEYMLRQSFKERFILLTHFLLKLAT